MAKLTAKQRRFCDEYLIDLNATQAAIRAGYSEKTARFIGNENLTKPYIQSQVQRLMDERSARTQVTANMVVEELAKIAFADIKDFLSFGTKQTVVDRPKDGEAIVDYIQVIQVKDSDDVDGTLIQEVSINSRGVFSFKLHDKMAALDKLGKHLGMFKEKVEVEDKTKRTAYDELTVEELRALAGQYGQYKNKH